jgi:integrase
MLASSGMRIGEVLALNWVDVKIPDRNKYPNKPTSIFVRTSKTGQSRLVYISRECELALAEWKKISPEFLVFSKRLSENFKTIKLLKQDRNETVFPFSSKTAYVMWNDALKKAGYFNMDTSTNRLQMNIHRLRTFFSVQVASVVGQQVSELLLGHGDAYGGAYTGRSTEQLEQEYIRAEPALTIGTTTFQIETALKKTVELEETVNALNSRDETNRLILEKATSREELILEIMGRMKKK